MLSAHQEPQDCICLSSVICHSQEADITASLRQWWLLLFFNLISKLLINTSISTWFLKNMILWLWFAASSQQLRLTDPLLFWPGKIRSCLCSRASYFHLLFLLHPWENYDLGRPCLRWEGRGLCNTKGLMLDYYILLEIWNPQCVCGGN